MQSEKGSKAEYSDKMKCCREYAYREDTNFPIRHQMEDSHFFFDNYLQDESSGLFAILDGHGGQEVVEYVTQVLPNVSRIGEGELSFASSSKKTSNYGTQTTQLITLIQSSPRWTSN